MVFPIQAEVIDLRELLNDIERLKAYKKEEIEQRKDLLKKKAKLVQIGFGTFLLNTLNTFLKLKNFENPFLKKGADILDEIANDLILKFFSFRRHLKGYEFEITNPEYYTNENEQSSESIETQKTVNVVKG